MKVLFYKTSSGRSHVAAELDDLPVQSRAHAYELLLHAYSKKSQKAPRHHIETALKRMADAIRRNML